MRSILGRSLVTQSARVRQTRIETVRLPGHQHASGRVPGLNAAFQHESIGAGRRQTRYGELADIVAMGAVDDDLARLASAVAIRRSSYGPATARPRCAWALKQRLVPAHIDDQRASVGADQRNKFLG